MAFNLVPGLVIFAMRAMRKGQELQRSHGRLTPRAEHYIEEIARKLQSEDPETIARNVRDIVRHHDSWRDEDAISLNAAENVLSRTARALLNSDLATRVSEGFPGHKDFPANRQNRFIDEIEASMIHMLRRMFDARHVEWRPVSTSMANATAFFSLTEPGDVILVQPEGAGGNYSYNPSGPTRSARINVSPLPFFHDTFEVDLDNARDAIARIKPRMIVIGGSNVLFPYPVSELREAADAVGSLLVYDAAHVALLIGCGQFQDPLKEGAHLLTFSTHKIMSGAVGGVILTNDDEIASKVLPYSFPTLIQTRDQNKYAATAHALAEMLRFGPDYSRQMIANARALAESLEAEGFDILCADRNYTETHQIFMFVSQAENETFEDLCQQANLLVTRAQRMGARSGIRLTTQEITRRGMTGAQMAQIAQWLRRIIRDGENPEIVANEVKEFLRGFRTIAFSFDD